VHPLVKLLRVLSHPQCDSSSNCSNSGVAVTPQPLTLISNSGSFQVSLVKQPSESVLFLASISSNNTLVLRPTYLLFTTANYSNPALVEVYAICPPNTAVFAQAQTIFVAYTSYLYCPVYVQINILAGTQCFANTTSSTFNNPTAVESLSKSMIHTNSKQQHNSSTRNSFSFLSVLLLLLYFVNQITL